MSRCRWFYRVSGLALALGLLALPAVYASPASRRIQDGGPAPAGIQQLESVVRSFFRPFANILSAFQMAQSNGEGPPKDRPQEGVGIDPNGRPPGQGGGLPPGPP